ncbi:MAG: SDR family NAD(P)-dependent oxidoreductase [bacterium]|nr:SDR family NAD(P)-dependent oxidoreductase [bacterium]
MSNDNLTGLEVAVVGMALRFPGAENVEQYWNNLENGVESISFFSEEELKENGVELETLKTTGYVNTKGGIIKNWDYFDASFFGYTPREAEVMAPQIRVFHECSWEALESAGYEPDTYRGNIGFYAGSSSSMAWEVLTHVSGKTREMDAITINTLSDKDQMTSRISYNLNLKGPSFSMETACSTSLIAIHLACQGILSGECEMALAGGIALSLPQKQGYFHQRGSVLSPDGHTRPFDAGAEGFAWSNGAGVVVLKALEEAIADGDTIHALVKGSAINNDGSRKVGYTAPSTKGQTAVIRAAHMMAEIEPENIGYIEAHGSGTPMGDPIEIEALKKVFNTGKKGFCAVGSVKSNLGHMADAAGVAGFIKTVLSLKHKRIPPSINFETPNPQIEFENTPFYVNRKLSEWESDKPRLAGVSAFAIGGSNAHVILQEAPEIKESSASREEQMLLLSAKTPTALDRQTESLANYLQENKQAKLADVAYSLQVGRKAFEYRRGLVCTGIDEAIENLTSENYGKAFTASSKAIERKVVFMFSGIGAQYVEMGKQLYQNEPLFREEMDRCFDIVTPLLGQPVKEKLYPSAAETANPADIHRPEIAQVVVFIFEYALAKLLMTWGIKPQAMIGYSFGEYTAATLAGVFSLEDALKLVVRRGQLIEEMPAGEMLSVPLRKEELQPQLDDDVSLAIDNGPSCIVAGPAHAMENFGKKMKDQRYLCMKLPNTRALHTTMMKPLEEKFKEEVGKITLNEPAIPYISNVTGEWIKPEEATTPAYWARHLSETVRFAEGMTQLTEEPATLFVELGPGRELRALAIRYTENNPDQAVINIVRPEGKKESDSPYLLNKIGRLWQMGQTIDWGGYYKEERRQRLPLPTYPFEREHYPMEKKNITDYTEGALNQINEGKKPNIDDWFYIPSWKRTVNPPQNKTPGKSYWLIFIENNGLGTQLAKQLERNGRKIIIVKKGDRYSKTGLEYTVDPGQSSHYETLMEAIGNLEKPLEKIIHLWNVTRLNHRQLNTEIIENSQQTGFFSLLNLVKAIDKQGLSDEIHLEVVTNNLQDVGGEEELCPEKATIPGLIKVIQQEYRYIVCRSIDIIQPGPGTLRQERLTEQLENEIISEPADLMVAYRGSNRWVQTYEPLPLKENTGEIPGIKRKGVYMITGGLGAIGLTVAAYLAGTYDARLVLVGRTPFPERDRWEGWLASHDEQDPVAVKIGKLKKITEKGAGIMTAAADVADKEQMKEVIARAKTTFGHIDGVIHCAGKLPGETFDTIRELNREQCREYFAAKIYGTLVLEELFREEKLEICILMSSIASVLGGLGFAAYSAANSFMDTYAHWHNRENRAHWLSVNWSDWLLGTAGMENTRETTPLDEFGMTAEEGINSFKRLFSAGKINQLVHSTGHLQTRLDKWIKLETLRGDTAARDETAANRPRPDLDTPYTPPGEKQEQELVEIWQNLFGFEPIGIHDDFLELGGDSLKAITMISMIHKKMHREVSLADFFNEPTIKGLAGNIKKTAKSRFVSIENVEKKEYYPLSSAQKRLFVMQQMDQNSISYNQTHLLMLEGKLEKEKLENVLLRLIERHEVFRTSIEIVENEPVQKINREVAFTIDYFEKKEDDARELVTTLIRPFDLSEAPFLRVALIKLAHQRHLFMIDMHHILTDGVSHEIFVNEFTALYLGEELAPLKLQYKEFSHWQNAENAKGAFKQQEQYWLKQFEDDAPVIQLPTDNPRPEIWNSEGQLITLTVGKELTAKVKQMVLETKVTLNSMLMAMINILLYKYSKQEDIVVGSAVSGRNHADLHNIIGMFVNMLPIRNRPRKDKTFRQFLDEVKENTLNAYNNQDLQFEELVRKLGLQGKFNRNPLFDVALELHNIDTMETQTPKQENKNKKNTHQLEILPYNHGLIASKFDLILGVEDHTETLQLKLLYSTALFKPATAEGILKHCEEILEQAVENRDTPLQEINISHGLAVIKSGQFEDDDRDFDF